MEKTLEDLSKRASGESPRRKVMMVVMMIHADYPCWCYYYVGSEERRRETL